MQRYIKNSFLPIPVYELAIRLTGFNHLQVKTLPTNDFTAIIVL